MENLAIVLNDGALVVDVRTRNEFMGGHVAGSLNIPLQVLPQHLDELKSDRPIVLCCASGGRSGIACILS